MKKKVWFITGASKGLGLALVKKLLAAGYSVAATSRNKAALVDAVNNNSEQLLPLEVDLSNEKSIAAAVQYTYDHFGKIDVLVNNAGYGIGGALEELSQQEILRSFDVNVFATINTIEAVMPFMRAQRSGHIINISSIAGFAAGTGWAVYAATKFAVTGLSEVLAEDVKEFGIKVTVVEPGAFRTSFLNPESLVMAEKQIDDYTDVRASHARYQAMDGTQAGDPEKAADLFIRLAEKNDPPVRLLLGSDAHKRAGLKIGILQKELEDLKEIIVSTDY